ncbi:hypothetical protein MMC10_010850 [Thelotrema lepadinum]|nr:hypothetical protein [Thelotrema lepadinum]
MANSVAVAIKPRISPDHAGLDPLASSWKQSHGRLTGTHGTQIRRNEGLLQPRAEKTLTKQDEIKRLAGKERARNYRAKKKQEDPIGLKRWCKEAYARCRDRNPERFSELRRASAKRYRDRMMREDAEGFLQRAREHTRKSRARKKAIKDGDKAATETGSHGVDAQKESIKVASTTDANGGEQSEEWRSDLAKYIDSVCDYLQGTSKQPPKCAEPAQRVKSPGKESSKTTKSTHRARTGSSSL